jgi:hypothetical protein
LARWYGGIDDFDVYRMHYSFNLPVDHSTPLTHLTIPKTARTNDRVPLAIVPSSEVTEAYLLASPSQLIFRWDSSA